MDLARMQDLSEMITKLKKAAGELEKIWRTHADGCKYYLPDDDDADCIHPDPSCDPICEHNNCPLLKQEV